MTHRLLSCALLAVALGLSAGPAEAQAINIDLGQSGSFTGQVVRLLLLVTVLSLAPSILVMVTSFTRIVIVLSFLRTAIGLQQSPPNPVLVSLALFLTLFVMQPSFEAAWRVSSFTRSAPHTAMRRELMPPSSLARIYCCRKVSVANRTVALVSKMRFGMILVCSGEGWNTAG